MRNCLVIKGKFGWDPIIKVCWLTSDNDADRLRWQISTQLAWILFTIFLTMLASVITIGHLYKHKVRIYKQSSRYTERLMVYAQFTSVRLLKAHAKTNSTSQKEMNSVDSAVATDRKRSGAYKGASRNLMTNVEFRKIILRISIYPVVMIILNLIITIADIRISTASGIYTKLDYGIYVIYYALYGARGLFYALIAVADPALIRAYKVWRGERNLSGLSQITALDNTLEAQSPKFQHDDSSNMPGISVQTEIESYVQETKPYHDFAYDAMPLKEYVGGTTTTTIESSSFPAKPARVYKRDSNPDLQSPDTIKKTTHWNDSCGSELSFVEERDADECSMSSLAPKHETSGDTDRHGVNVIRQRQLARLEQRKKVERDMKRQI